MWLYYSVMHTKDADGIANSVDPDQKAVWSGSTLFAKTCPFENLGSLKKCFQKMQKEWQTMQTLIRLLHKGPYCFPRPVCQKLGSLWYILNPLHEFDSIGIPELF